MFHEPAFFEQSFFVSNDYSRSDQSICDRTLKFMMLKSPTFREAEKLLKVLASAEDNKHHSRRLTKLQLGAQTLTQMITSSRETSTTYVL